MNDPSMENRKYLLTVREVLPANDSPYFLRIIFRETRREAAVSRADWEDFDYEFYMDTRSGHLHTRRYPKDKHSRLHYSLKPDHPNVTSGKNKETKLFTTQAVLDKMVHDTYNEGSNNSKDVILPLNYGSKTMGDKIQAIRSDGGCTPCMACESFKEQEQCKHFKKNTYRDVCRFLHSGNYCWLGQLALE